MHNYLTEYFDYLYNKQYKVSINYICFNYDDFILNAYLYLNPYDIINIVNTKFPYIKRLYNIYRNKLYPYDIMYKNFHFYGSYYILMDYEKDLEILLRKEKIKKLNNNINGNC